MKQKGVYQKYLEMEKQKEKEKKIKEKYGIDENTRFLLMYNEIIIVTSIVGTTILLNLNLRTFFFDYIAKLL